jgi:hypothetical protein
MKKLLTVSILLLSGSLFSAAPALAEIAVIASANSGAKVLDAKIAKKLFLGKLKSIPGMNAVTLVGQVDTSPTKAEFTQMVAKKGLDKYKAYWSKMIFSGKAVPPKELANDAEVKAYVASHNDAVGYINTNAVDDSVKVLLRAP